MESPRIRHLVDTQINLWLDLQKKEERKVIISSRAVKFIYLMIENIEADKSEYWNLQRTNIATIESQAISLIPNALNEIFAFRRFSRYESLDKKEIRISSWELWHSLSAIIDKFCFIPKDI